MISQIIFESGFNVPMAKRNISIGQTIGEEDQFH